MPGRRSALESAPVMTTLTYQRPTSLREALETGGSDGARFVSGGTDLMVQRRSGRSGTENLVSLRRVEELAGIDWKNDQLRIGAAVPLAGIGADQRIARDFPALAQAIAALGSVQIRNVATLGGNLCNASPAADTAPALLAYEARIEIANTGGTRTVGLDEFFTGPGSTVLQPGELLTAILLDARQSAGSAFMRLGRVRMDLAIASAAALVEIEDNRCTHARVAVGAVAPTPLRLSAVEEILEGKAPDGPTLAKAQAAVDALISPISDLRASARHRRRITPVLVARALEAAISMATGDAQ
ncbi:MAG: carbon monoxide dehydrogenase [Planctomycetes bacterium]|mgnify:CR=1 FL=1|nr:carbon monoxide dehydrogenase [Planctomycetota bacterium]MBV20871.1 carbon monoxide dehydrogenase [Planctomycetaceae bacterium]